MDNKEPVYQNIIKKQPKPKTVFDHFPWKLKLNSRTTGDKVFARSRSASDFERTLHNDVNDVSYDPPRLPSGRRYSRDDSCTDNPENAATRRSKMFGAPVSFDIQSGIPGGKTINNMEPSGDMEGTPSEQTREENANEDSAIYANIPAADCLETREDSAPCEHANVNDVSDKSKRASVAICEVKPTVREDGADEFRRERNKAIRRSTSVKKTVTFKLDKPDAFVDPPSPHPFRNVDNIVIHPKPETGIIKNAKYTTAKESFLYDDVDDLVPRSSQLSPNGTSSDSGRDSFLSCCSECNCSGPNHYECERPQCQVYNLKDDPLQFTMDHMPKITVSEAEVLKQAYEEALKDNKDPLKFTYDRVAYTPAFITSKLEDSIYMARKNRKVNKTPRHLEPGVTAKSAEYLNIDVAQSILQESRVNQFATYKSSEHIYASVKDVSDVSDKKEPPVVPPRESTQNNDVTRSNSMSDISRRLQTRGRHHKRPSKNDLLLLNKFHSYTLGDVMDNYSSILEDIPQDGSLLRQSELDNSKDDTGSSSSKSHRLSELTDNPINSLCVPDHTTPVKSSNIGLKTNEPQSALSRNPPQDQAKGDKVFKMRTEFGPKQRPFLSIHKQRAQSESAILKRMDLTTTNSSDKRVFGERKSVNPHASTRNDPSQHNPPSSASVAVGPHSKAISNDSTPPLRTNAPEATQRAARALNARFMDERRQEYANRSKSWSCWPDSFRGISPIQCLPEQQQASNPAVNRIAGAKINNSYSQYGSNNVPQSRLSTSPLAAGYRTSSETRTPVPQSTMTQHRSQSVESGSHFKSSTTASPQSAFAQTRILSAQNRSLSVETGRHPIQSRPRSAQSANHPLQSRSLSAQSRTQSEQTINPVSHPVTHPKPQSRGLSAHSRTQSEQTINPVSHPITNSGSHINKESGGHSSSSSPYDQKRQFRDIRWVADSNEPKKYALSNAALSKSVSMSTPVIKWTKSEMAEIFC